MNWITEQYYHHQVLAEAPPTEALRQRIRDFLAEKGETVRRLAVAGTGPSANGTDLWGFVRGNRKIGPKLADRLVAAMDGYPASFPDGPAHPEMAYARSTEYRLQKEINANRDAAAQRRRAHVEACRAEEFRKYGFTTIDRDVTEMAA